MVQTAYITTITSSTTLTTDFDTYIIDISSNITITLPNITCDGIFVNLRRIDVTTFVATINCTGGQLINGNATTTMSYKGDITFRSLNGDWITADTFSPASAGGKLSFLFPESGNPYMTLAPNTGSSTVVCNFYYPGSNNSGGVPSIFAMIFAIPNSAIFKIDLIHLSGGSGVTIGSVIATLTNATTPLIPTIMSTNTVTLSNISPTECIWEIRATKQSGNQGIRVYNCFIGL